MASRCLHGGHQPRASSHWASPLGRRLLVPLSLISREAGNGGGGPGAGRRGCGEQLEACLSALSPPELLVHLLGGCSVYA